MASRVHSRTHARRFFAYLSPYILATRSSGCHEERAGEARAPGRGCSRARFLLVCSITRHRPALGTFIPEDKSTCGHD